MIKVNLADGGYLHLLWVDDIYTKDSKVFSPFPLNAVLRHHLEKFESRGPGFFKKLAQFFYVNDLVTGATDTIEAYKVSCKAYQRTLDEVFELRKLRTSDSDLIEIIAECSNK